MWSLSGRTASEGSFLMELPDREGTHLPVPERSNYVAYLHTGRCKVIYNMSSHSKSGSLPRTPGLSIQWAPQLTQALVEGQIPGCSIWEILFK